MWHLLAFQFQKFPNKLIYSILDPIGYPTGCIFSTQFGHLHHHQKSDKWIPDTSWLAIGFQLLKVSIQTAMAIAFQFLRMASK